MKRILSVTAAAVVLATGSVACQAPVPIQNTPSPSGTLRVVGSADEEYVRGMTRAFELETGIHTTYERLSAGDALARLEAEQSAPTFSVWWGGSADGYIAADDEGLLQANRPRGAAKIPQQFKDADGHWTGIWVGALAFAVNRRVLAEQGLPEPTSWADLTDPIYRGQIAIAHPATSGTAYTVLVTIMQLNDKDVDRGFAYLSALHENVRAYTREGPTPALQAGKGEVAIGIAFAHDIVATIEDGYPDLAVVFPSEGTGYEIGAMALLQDAPQPELGKQFMDWALSDRAEELGPLFSAYQIPTNPDARVPQQSVRLSSIKTISHDFRWAGDHRRELVTRFSISLAPAPQAIGMPGQAQSH